MRRRIVFAAAGVVVAGAAAATGLALAPLKGAETRALAALRDATGLEVRANGRTTVSVFPSPEIRIDGVSFASGDEEPFAAAREVAAAPRLGALLLGRFELASVTLRQPQVALDRSPVRDGLGALTRAQAGRAGLPEIRIVDGRMSLTGREVTSVNGALVWSGAGRPLAVTGYGRFAGRPIELAVTLADPASIGRDGGTPVRARLEGGGARALFDGSAADAGSGPRLAGALRIRAGSLRETLGWLGAPTPRRSSPLADFSLAGQAFADDGGLSISNAELDLEGDSFLGAGRFTKVAGRPSVEATLDAKTLDLKPYILGLAPGMSENGGWRTKPLDLGAIQGFDLDLRLSAGRVKAGGWRLSQMAATVAVANGALDISVGEAGAYGGSVGGRLSVDPDGDRAKVRLETAVTDVRLGDALKALLPAPAVSGALTGEFSAQGSGRSIAEIVSDFQGKARAQMVDGAIAGLGASRALALAGLRGAMAVTSADADFSIRGGVARTAALKIVGPDAAFSLAGEARLADRDLKLEGYVTPAEGGWTLPVRIDGPFAAPRVRPNLSRGAPAGEARNDAR